MKVKHIAKGIEKKEASLKGKKENLRKKISYKLFEKKQNFDPIAVS